MMMLFLRKCYHLSGHILKPDIFTQQKLQMIMFVYVDLLHFF